MPIPITRILFCLALCLMVFSCCCKSPEYECIEMQDVAVIRAGYNSGFPSFYNDNLDSMVVNDVIFDSMVVRKDNEEIRRYSDGNLSYQYPFLIGSQTHKAKFPIRINAQLFLHKALPQSLDFEMPENSVLTFYVGTDCDKTFTVDSTSADSRFVDSFKWSNFDSWSDYQMYMERSPFYQDVRYAIKDGVFIDSSRSEIACWVMKRMTDGQMINEDMRCSKWKREDGKEFDIYYDML